VYRGEIWWANLSDPTGSEPGYRRPVLVVQDDTFNQSNINTVIIATITSNLRLADAPGNVLLSSQDSGLPRDSVVNVSQILTIDKSVLTERVSSLANPIQEAVDEGLEISAFSVGHGVIGFQTG
jgi:mRNA interferase MazF